MQIQRPAVSAKGSGNQKRRENLRKRVSTVQKGDEVPKKIPRTNETAPVIKEINPSHVRIKETRLGTGSFDSCYLGSYRGLDKAVKQLKLNPSRRETLESASRKEREALRYEARIMN